MKNIEIVDVQAKPSKIKSGEQVEFIVKLKASKTDEVKFSIRELDGLLHYNGEDIFDKVVKVEKGTSTVTFKAQVEFAKPVDQFNFEMQLNTENIEIPPAPFKFNLTVISDDQQKAA